MAARKSLIVLSSGVIRHRSGLPQPRALAARALHGSAKVMSSSAAAGAEASGPPFKKYFWITTGVMFGIPSAFGAAFVYNLKTDDEFYEHFTEKYPDLVSMINEYVPLNEPSVYADRDDVGEVTSTSELLNETVTIVAVLRSGRKVRFQAQGSASQAEIETLALQHAGAGTDSVVSIVFDEESADDGDAASTTSVSVEEMSEPSKTVPVAAVWPPAPRTMWMGEKTKPRAPALKEVRTEIEAIRLKQMELEEAKYTGRDIDEADEEIRELEARKTELKKLLPRKRFLWIF